MLRPKSSLVMPKPGGRLPGERLSAVPAGASIWPSGESAVIGETTGGIDSTLPANLSIKSLASSNGLMIDHSILRLMKPNANSAAGANSIVSLFLRIVTCSARSLVLSSVGWSAFLVPSSDLLKSSTVSRPSLMASNRSAYPRPNFWTASAAASGS